MQPLSPPTKNPLALMTGSVAEPGEAPPYPSQLDPTASPADASSPTAKDVVAAADNTAKSQFFNPKNSLDAVQLSREARELAKLAERDRTVRTHEAAHAAVGGPYAGSPTLTYTSGPDGRSYAVGGEVSIDMSPVAGDPQATLEKAQTVRAAALAPAQPSAQDMRVAARAMQMAARAYAELSAPSQKTSSFTPPDRTPAPASIQDSPPQTDATGASPGPDAVSPAARPVQSHASLSLHL